MRVVPFYRQIAETIKSRIVEGAYGIGECIPPATELEETFGVSNITIRKALDLLREEGWIQTQQGIGSVVRRNDHLEVVDIKFSGKFDEWLEWASGKSHNIKQTVLGIDKENGSLHVRELLGAPAGEQLWRMRRVRSIDGEPISYHVNYARPESVEKIKSQDLQGTGSFIELMHERYPHKVARIEQYVEATIANMDLAQVLHIKYGDPIFRVEHRYVTHDDRVIVVAHLSMRADRYRYSTTISTDELKRSRRNAD